MFSETHAHYSALSLSHTHVCLEVKEMFLGITNVAVIPCCLLLILIPGKPLIFTKIVYGIHDL